MTLLSTRDISSIGVGVVATAAGAATATTATPAVTANSKPTGTRTKRAAVSDNE